MLKITAQPNAQKNGFNFPSKYNKATLLEWFKKYKVFEISPVVNESQKSRGYLEGAVVDAYCEWQYGINPREKGRQEQKRFLFKRDFCYEIVNDKDGNPIRVPVSSKGKAAIVSNTYTQWAEENGAPIPNPALYKLWRDKYAIDIRFPTFFEFLDFLGLQCDALPTPQDLAKLKVEEEELEYPEEESNLDKIPF